MVLEKTLESPLVFKEIQPVHSEGDQPWDFLGRNKKAERIKDKHIDRDMNMCMFSYMNIMEFHLCVELRCITAIKGV